MKIAIDAGHGYNTAGKRTPDGIREWTLNNAVANYLAEYLKGYATTFRVDDTTGKTDIKLSTRRNNAINKGAKLLVSLHHNALKKKWNKVTGIETYSHTLYANKEAKELSVKLASAISKETGLKNRGAKKAMFAVIATSKITCVLCEGGFMDGETDSKYIRTEEGQRAYAKAVADTIITYYGLKKTTTTKTSTKKSVETIAKEVIDGKWGTGNTRKTKLTNAGYNYNEVQAKVNELLKAKTPTKVIVNYYPKCASSHTSIVSALKSIKVNSSFAYRRKIANKNGIKSYVGTAKQNIKLLNLLKSGKLLKV